MSPLIKVPGLPIYLDPEGQSSDPSPFALPLWKPKSTGSTLISEDAMAKASPEINRWDILNDDHETACTVIAYENGAITCTCENFKSKFLGTCLHVEEILHVAGVQYSRKLCGDIVVAAPWMLAKNPATYSNGVLNMIQEYSNKKGGLLKPTKKIKEKTLVEKLPDSSNKPLKTQKEIVNKKSDEIINALKEEELKLKVEAARQSGKKHKLSVKDSLDAMKGSFVGLGHYSLAAGVSMANLVKKLGNINEDPVPLEYKESLEYEAQTHRYISKSGAVRFNAEDLIAGGLEDLYPNITVEFAQKLLANMKRKNMEAMGLPEKDPPQPEVKRKFRFKK